MSGPGDRLRMSQRVLQTAMKTLRLLGAERRISVPHLAILLAVASVLYTLAFCIWTRTSPWAFVRFVAAIVLVSYLPEKSLVVAARLRLVPLEDWALSFPHVSLVIACFLLCLGCMIGTLSGIAALRFILDRPFSGVCLAGWPSLVVPIWSLGG